MPKCPHCKKEFERDVDVRIVYPDNADAPGLRCAVFICPNGGVWDVLGSYRYRICHVQGVEEL